MKTINISFILVLLFIVLGCKSKQVSETPFEIINTNIDEKGNPLEFCFLPGKYHNHPTLVIWIEDVEGKYLEPIFVTKYIGTGFFGYGSLGNDKWNNQPGYAERPSALPYWFHKRNHGMMSLPSAQNPVADAITGATPQAAFVLNAKTIHELPERFRVMMEINQTWDWNDYWHNTLYPDDFGYRVSCQPALVYSVMINKNKPGEYYLNPIGHSHYSGKDGELYTDLSTLTTAKEIVYKAFVKIK